MSEQNMNHQPTHKSKHQSAHPSLAWWQKRPVNISVALLGLALVIIMITVNVTKYERHLATGDTVLLALAPVDPRGFMQGDYMTLSYALEEDIFAALDAQYASNSTSDKPSTDDIDDFSYRAGASAGYVIVALDKNNVGQFVRLSDSKPDALAANEKALYYRKRHFSIKLATNAFFFQEGHADAFAAAEYGLFRVNDKGEPLLTELVDEDFNIIVGYDNEGVDNEHEEEAALAE